MKDVTVFMYHDIRDFDDTEFPSRYKEKSFLRVADFISQLEYIQRYYKVIPLKSLQEVMRHGIDDNYAILTFDDGLKDHLFAAGALSDLGITGTFFLPFHSIIERTMMKTHKIQFIIAEGGLENVTRDILAEIPPEDAPVYLFHTYSQSLWPDNYWPAKQVFITRFLREYHKQDFTQRITDKLFEKYVTKNKKFEDDFYLNLDDIKSMREMGMTIGGHGYMSENLTTFSETQQSFDIGTATYFLESMEVEELYFSYPNGGVNANVEFITESYGYKYAFGTRNHTLWEEPRNLLNLPRIDAAQKLPL